MNDLLSCGGADDSDAIVAAPPATAAPLTPLATPAAIAASDPSTSPSLAPALDTFTLPTTPPFTYVEGTSLWDDGYDVPDRSASSADLREAASAPLRLALDAVQRSLRHRDVGVLVAELLA